MASAIALKTFADVQERGELYASIYLHVKRQYPTVRRLRAERIVLEDRQLSDGIADAPTWDAYQENLVTGFEIGRADVIAVKDMTSAT